jgi:hypothetical protein
MSDDRLSELGIPRRRFLKNTAAAAFVAPVVVSFGLDAIAEAHTGSLPNQCLPNQSFPNQFSRAEHDLVDVIGIVITLVQNGKLGFGPAHSMSEKALKAALQLANDHPKPACAKINALVNEIQRTPNLPLELLHAAQDAQQSAGCSCFQPH